jgi:hypothetical protein
MSTPFSNPWSNPNNPVDMYRRYKRRKAKRAAASAEAKTDPRSRDVENNRQYESERAQTASAYQSHQSRKVWNDPFSSAKQQPSGLWTPWDRPSPNYDPSDW